MGNTALSAVLGRSNTIEKKPVKAKRGVNTHLGALTSLARSERDATESDIVELNPCLLYTSPSPRDQRGSRMPSSA